VPQDAIDLSDPNCWPLIEHLCVQHENRAISPAGRRLLERTQIKLRRLVELHPTRQVLGGRIHRRVGECTRADVFQAAANDNSCQAVIAAKASVIEQPRSIVLFGLAIDKQAELARASNLPKLFATVDTVDPCKLIAAWRWVYGPDLGTRPSPSKELQHVAALVTDVARTLQLYHDHGIVHCATCPRNLIWDKEATTLVLIDPTGAFFAEGAHLWSKAPHHDGFDAPELFQGARAITSKVDVFAVAQLIWKLATHQSPVPPATGKAFAPAIKESSLPERLKRLIHAGTHADPAQRPNLEELTRELNEIAHRPSSIVIPPIAKSLGQAAVWAGIAVLKSCAR
jgi:serine/threonine protein kinase